MNGPELPRRLMTPMPARKGAYEAVVHRGHRRRARTGALVGSGALVLALGTAALANGVLLPTGRDDALVAETPSPDATTSSTPSASPAPSLSPFPPPSSPPGVSPSPSADAMFFANQAFRGLPWQRRGITVPADVAGVHTGPEHCGWQRAVFLTVGLPLGSGYRTSHHQRSYVRDPEAVLPQLRRFESGVALPPDARSTGYSLDGVELWLGPDQVRFAYLVGPGRTYVERWPAWTGSGCQ